MQEKKNNSLIWLFCLPAVFIILSLILVVFTQVELLICTEQVPANVECDGLGSTYVGGNGCVAVSEYTYEGNSYTTYTTTFVEEINIGVDYEIESVYINPKNPEHVVIPELNYQTAETLFGIGFVFSLAFLVALIFYTP